MAAHPNPAAQRFGKWLNHELKARGMGKRTLARRIVGKGASLTAIDHERRKVTEYAAGRVNPSPVARRKIARALRIRIDELPPLEDESDLSVEGYCLMVTGKPVEKVGMELAADLRRGAARSLRQARQIESALDETENSSDSVSSSAVEGAS